MRIFSPFKGINTLFRAGKCWIFLYGVITEKDPEISIGCWGCRGGGKCSRAGKGDSSHNSETVLPLRARTQIAGTAWKEFLCKRKPGLNCQARGHFGGCQGWGWSHLQSDHCGRIWGVYRYAWGWLPFELGYYWIQAVSSFICHAFCICKW